MFLISYEELIKIVIHCRFNKKYYDLIILYDNKFFGDQNNNYN